MKLLIIDDEELLVEVFKPILERQGVEVLNSQTGEGGIEILKKEKPSVVLLDISLKGTMNNGIKVLEEIRKIDQTCQIVMITGSDASLEKECLAKGANFYLTKPIRLSTIKDILAKARQKNTNPEGQLQ